MSVKNPRRYNWGEQEVEDMLNLIRDGNMLRLLDGKKYRGLQVYSEVAAKMKDLSGYDRTPEQVRCKLKNLKKEYRKTRRNNLISGSTEQGFMFYELLDEIFSTAPIIVRDEDGIQNGLRKNGTPIKSEESSSGFSSTPNGSKVKTEKRSFSEVEAAEDVLNISNVGREKIRKSSIKRGAKIKQNLKLHEVPNSLKFGRQKRQKKSFSRIAAVEEEIMKRNQDFLQKEFEKQRRFEEKQNEKFIENIKCIFNEFLLHISGTASTSAYLAPSTSSDVEILPEVEVLLDPCEDSDELYINE